MTSAGYPPIVFVSWVDAANAVDHWTDREDAVRTALHLSGDPIYAAGFLLADTEKVVVLALLLNHHSDDVAHVASIPKAAIVKMTVVRAARDWAAG